MPQQNPHTEGRARRWFRIGGAVLALLAVGGTALLGWRWYRSIPVRRVVVKGATHAAPDTLAALARVDTGQALYRLQPRLLTDRVRRHPWVKSAAVSRYPNGTLRITVDERTPAALVLQDGAAAYYLDAAGYPLPLASGLAAYDVPLVRGLEEAYQPLRPTGHTALRRLLAALERDTVAEALVSEIRVQDAPLSKNTSSPGRASSLGAGHSGAAEAHPKSTSSRAVGALRLRMVPDGRGQSATVRLGRGGFPRKLRTLTAFWQQAVREKPHAAFHEIDLRFDGQVVAREESFTPPSSAP